LPNGNVVQYYVAAQDENSTTVRTLPAGGGGSSPPGSTPPGTFFEFLVADLTAIWSDSANSKALWTATGGWDTTTQQSVSQPTSFTDSPGGNYPLNSRASLTCKDQIPAQNSLKTFLEFDTRWAIEFGVHFGRVQISTDGGGSWYSLGGQYTYLKGPPAYATDSGPVYTGVQSSWVHEVSDISDYAKHPFNIRFVFFSDNVTYWMPLDGWYIDNVNISILESANSADTYVQLPTAVSLAQNYPNPFNPSTTITYALPKSSDMRLSVYDLLGREVSVLVNERKDAGVHEVKFDGSGLSSGVYLYRLRAGDFVQTRKLLLLQ
jgi:hypothetical protein